MIIIFAKISSFRNTFRTVTQEMRGANGFLIKASDLSRLSYERNIRKNDAMMTSLTDTNLLMSSQKSSHMHKSSIFFLFCLSAISILNVEHCPCRNIMFALLFMGHINIEEMKPTFSASSFLWWWLCFSWHISVYFLIVVLSVSVYAHLL